MEQDPIAQSLALADTFGLDLSPMNLLAGFVFNVLGYYLWREARKRRKTRALWIGVAMMIFPLFVSGALRVTAVGLGLCAAAYFFWDRDASD